ncbi:C-type lectin domain family 1 member A [Galemys pyrenaicus]|uniref:C-type lectin domain family 1 member A n=1 Tax=Galemys pyrenaicus TaxID=202257 RepID=A0A8J5ZPN2_GALPY|nr:C-type lectin domain family 1 member A [Galemys pyrenaicus]
MPAKRGSARDALDADGDTTTSLYSDASSATRRPELERAEAVFSTRCRPQFREEDEANRVFLVPAEPGPPSPAWRPAALTLLTLCLALLLGLAALGFAFFQFYELSITQQDTISHKEERLGNLSRQLQALQTQNRELMETLQRVAEKLCRELHNKTGEHKCSPCPDSWKWHGDKCYQFSKESKSWQGCEYFCFTANSTMLKINTQEVLDLALPQSYSEFFYSYWTGLSRNGSGKAWLWIDGAPYSPELFQQPEKQRLCDHPQWKGFLQRLQRAEAVCMREDSSPGDAREAPVASPSCAIRLSQDATCTSTAEVTADDTITARLHGLVARTVTNTYLRMDVQAHSLAAYQGKPTPGPEESPVPSGGAAPTTNP